MFFPWNDWRQGIDGKDARKGRATAEHSEVVPNGHVRGTAEIERNRPVNKELIKGV